MSNQLDPIIAILKNDGQIDNFRCIEEKLTIRLGARIFDLKQKGWDFRTEMRPNKNTVYIVTKQPEPKQLQLA